jgi:hypothetical protein
MADERTSIAKKRAFQRLKMPVRNPYRGCPSVHEVPRNLSNVSQTDGSLICDISAAPWREMSS